MQQSKNCVNCQKEFFKNKISKAQWNLKTFCSGACHYEYVRKTGITRGKNNPSWKGGKVEKVCKMCNKTYFVWPFQDNSFICSNDCRKLYQKTDEFKQKISQANRGKKLSEEQKQKISEFHKGRWIGEKNSQWKGDDVGYRSIHEWVIRHKGTPTICEHCGLDAVKEKKRLCWANLSHKYLRQLDDWARLCYTCHRKYDFPNEKHRT